MQATEYVIVPEGCKPGVRIYIYSPLFGARLATQSILCFGFKWHFHPWHAHTHRKGRIPSQQCEKIDLPTQFPFSPFSCFTRRARRVFFEAEILHPTIFLFTSRPLLRFFYIKYSRAKSGSSSSSDPGAPFRNPDLNFKSAISIPPKSLAPTLTTNRTSDVAP